MEAKRQWSISVLTLLVLRSSLVLLLCFNDSIFESHWCPSVSTERLRHGRSAYRYSLDQWFSLFHYHGSCSADDPLAVLRLCSVSYVKSCSQGFIIPVTSYFYLIIRSAWHPFIHSGTTKYIQCFYSSESLRLSLHSESFSFWFPSKTTTPPNFNDIWRTEKIMCLRLLKITIPSNCHGREKYGHVAPCSILMPVYS